MMIKSSIINDSIESHDLDKRAILTMVGNAQMRDIFMTIKNQPMTASQIIASTKIPQTTAYRKLTWLLKKGLIRGKIIKPLIQGASDMVLFYTLIKEFSYEWQSDQVNVIMAVEE